MRFVEDRQQPVHSNLSERNLRRQAVGRKNCLFVGSDDGGHTNARFTWLLARGRKLEVEPLWHQDAIGRTDASRRRLPMVRP